MKTFYEIYLSVFKKYILLLLIFVISCGSRKSSGGFSGYKSTSVSYYADKFDGNKTASGETYRHHKMTGAHKSLSFGTRVEIVNVENDRAVIITVNDRGPIKPAREFDLSQGAFKKISNLRSGVVKVKYRIVK